MFAATQAHSEAFLAVVKGLQSPMILGRSEVGIWCFASRFMDISSTAQLPSAARGSLQTTLDMTFYVGLMSHLLSYTFPTRTSVERVDMEVLVVDWALYALVADRTGLTSDASPVLSLVFEHYWRTAIEPTVRGHCKIGWLGIGKYHSYFRNLFAAGALLGLMFDMRTREASAPAAGELGSRGGAPVDLAELRRGFCGQRYANLVGHHVSRQNKGQILAGVTGTMALLPLKARGLVEPAIDDWNRRGYDAAFWRRACADVFDEMLVDMRGRLMAVGAPIDDEVLFNLFQIVTMNFAHSASDQRTMRRFRACEVGGRGAACGKP